MEHDVDEKGGRNQAQVLPFSPKASYYMYYLCYLFHKIIRGKQDEEFPAFQKINNFLRERREVLIALMYLTLVHDSLTYHSKIISMTCNVKTLFQL